MTATTAELASKAFSWCTSSARLIYGSADPSLALYYLMPIYCLVITALKPYERIRTSPRCGASRRALI